MKPDRLFLAEECPERRNIWSSCRPIFFETDRATLSSFSLTNRCVILLKLAREVVSDGVEEDGSNVKGTANLRRDSTKVGKSYIARK